MDEVLGQVNKAAEEINKFFGDQQNSNLRRGGKGRLQEDFDSVKKEVGVVNSHQIDAVDNNRHRPPMGNIPIANTNIRTEVSPPHSILNNSDALFQLSDSEGSDLEKTLDRWLGQKDRRRNAPAAEKGRNQNRASRYAESEVRPRGDVYDCDSSSPPDSGGEDLDGEIVELQCVLAEALLAPSEAKESHLRC